MADDGLAQQDERIEGGGSSPLGGYRVEFALHENGGYGWNAFAATGTPDGGIVVPCTLMDANVYGPMLKVVRVSPTGSHEVIATIGDRSEWTRRHYVGAIERGFDGGYVLGGRELEFVRARVQEVVPNCYFVGADGSIEWTTRIPDVDGAVSDPIVRAITRLDGAYVLALNDGTESGTAAIAAIEPDGSIRWTSQYEVDGRTTVALTAIETADGRGIDGESDGEEAIVAGAHMPTPSGPSVPKPMLARVSADGTIVEETTPSVDGGRFPYDLAVADGRYLLAGVRVESDYTIAPPGWLMELDGFGGEPAYSQQREHYGTELGSVASSPLWDGPMVSGETEDDGFALADATAEIPGWRHEIADGEFREILPGDDGSAYLVGKTGDRGDTKLSVLRVSAPLDPGAMSIELGTESLTAGDVLSLSLDPGHYDPDLLDVTWTVDGTEVATGRSAEATIEDSGDRTVAAAVATRDDRTATIERTVSVSSSGSDSLPGFGLVAAGSGLAGAALYERYRRGSQGASSTTKE